MPDMSLVWTWARDINASPSRRSCVWQGVTAFLTAMAVMAPSASAAPNSGPRQRRAR
eukprot:CAMPEP_0204051432 /NCGR_PEP_ID=MMETSP0360-20130528/122387_1 /ASSEMBLY_ACC=CAM_ASM_000342 /TAXON_ID=268821 /ORGANISM="Scrippsiella Hangoei, Strain SHTV-5" /LENGTH=56 /DNA_ID=CAMNT_0050998457 /DNA_START=20 /DNA_END=187 /DNA_ORIENTATION=+